MLAAPHRFRLRRLFGLAAAGWALAASVACAGLMPTGEAPGGEIEDPPPGGDTVNLRLREMRFSMGEALLELKKADPKPHGDFIPGLLAEMDVIFAELARTEAYLREHPTENPLPSRPLLPGMGSSSVALLPSVATNPTHPRVAAVYPSLEAAQRSLWAALNTFVNGRPERGRGLMTALGGHRDALLRRISRLDGAIAEATQNLARDQPPQFRFAGAPPEGARGSITGVVEMPNGQPVPFALVSIITVREYVAQRPPVPGSAQADALARAAAEGRPPPALRTVMPTSMYSGGQPVAIANAQGEFVIRDLPPEAYIVTVKLLESLTSHIGSRQPVEVKPGAETKLATPIQMQQRGGRGT